MLNQQFDVLHSEKEMKFNGFKAIIDRIDRFDNGVKIIDYKTGNPSSKKDMLMFKDPQLLIESYISENQGLEVKDLCYWQMKGYGAEPISEKNVGLTGRNKEQAQEDFEEFKDYGYKTLEEIKEYFSEEDATFYPYSYGDSENKQSVCKYCPYVSVCRKFTL